MPNLTDRGTARPASRRVAAALALALTLALCAPPVAFAAYPGDAGYYPPGYDPATYPANYNPYLIISDFNWRDSTSMSQAEIQAFLASKNSVLTNYSCEEGGPNGLHSTVIKPASVIIAEAAAYWNVNPKLILATLEKEQSLITQVWHEGTYNGPYVYPWPTGAIHGTGYHLINAMGVGCYPGSTDTHPGFGDQVWTGTQKLGSAPTDPSSAYYWVPGRVKTVYSYPSAASVQIVPMNQPTWNFYAYTPYFPQISVWTQYNKFFGDPRIDAVAGRIQRFYNRVNGSHFYTASATEAQNVARNLSAIYTFEGPAYSLDTTSGANGQPLFRFYNKRNGSHFYTVSEAERDATIRNLRGTYTFEGAAYMVSVDPISRTPVYRFYNRQGNSHFYTIDPAERDWVIRQLGWKYTYEGVAYYVALAR